MDTAPPLDQLRVSDLLARLGSDVLTPIDDQVTADPVVTECVLWDPDDLLPSSLGSILLMPSGAERTELSDVIDEAARLGYAALVLKFRGRSASELGLTNAPRSLRILATADDTPWASLLNLINAAVASSRAVIGGAHPNGPGDLFALADTIAATTGGAVTIENVNREVLGYSNLPGQAIDESRRSTILGRLVPGVPRLLAEYRQLASTREPVQFMGEDGDIPRCAVSVWMADRLLGSVWVLVPVESEANRVSQVLSDIVPVVALQMAKAEERSEVDRARRTEMLAAALGLSSAEAESARHDLRDRFPVVLMGFRMAGGVDSWDHRRIVDLLSVHAEVTRSRSLCAQVGSTAFVLLPQANSLRRARLRELAQTCRRVARDAMRLDMKAAYSGIVRDIQQLPETRLRLESALRWLVRPSTTAALCDIEAEYHHVVLQDLAESPMLAADRQIPVLRSMLQHDRQHHTSYARTVLAHLEHLGQVSAASAAMSIHENSYRYRLRRAAAEFGLDLGDPDITLALWMQLHAIRDALP